MTKWAWTSKLPPKATVCCQCGHLVLEASAIAVPTVSARGTAYDWYCQAHRPVYDSVEYLHYFKRFEVSEDGIPLGYTKLKRE